MQAARAVLSGRLFIGIRLGVGERPARVGIAFKDQEIEVVDG
jgi:hypothetical protein